MGNGMEGGGLDLLILDIFDGSVPEVEPPVCCPRGRELMDAAEDPELLRALCRAGHSALAERLSQLRDIGRDSQGQADSCDGAGRTLRDRADRDSEVGMCKALGVPVSDMDELMLQAWGMQAPPAREPVPVAMAYGGAPESGRGFVVELSLGCWAADWDGDPGRTLRMENAQVFCCERDADSAIVAAREYRPFKHAKVTPAPATPLSPARTRSVLQLLTSLLHNRETPAPAVLRMLLDRLSPELAAMSAADAYAEMHPRDGGGQ